MTAKHARRLVVLVAAGVSATLLTPASSSADGISNQTLQLTSKLLLLGLDLLDPRLLELNARLRFSANIASVAQTDIDVQLGSTTDGIDERIKTEENGVLRALLEAERHHLEVDQRRNELLAEQNKMLGTILNQQEQFQVQFFTYQKQHDEGLLRKARYAVPADQLVVVVADFSSGEPDQGREVADEIAVHLTELTKYGIKVHILTGEIKPGVVIRSEEMARDVGLHLPDETDYVVIWGSMSPRTVGRYRPHITCVQKVGANRGVSSTYTINLESSALPLQADKENYQRQCYERLIGTTCAAIPSYFAVYEIGRERTLDLKSFYEWLGKDLKETKDFQNALKPLTQWTEVKAAYQQDKAGWTPARLKRIANISKENPFPLVIVNEKDGSMMRLITDEMDETQKTPKRFPGASADKDAIVYIDVLEATVGQYVQFLNESGENKVDGGTPWIKIVPATPGGPLPDLEQNPTLPNPFVAIAKHKQCAVANVSWFGARAYCHWSGKELPSVEQWQAAAKSADGGPYPWGKAPFALNAELCNLNPGGNDRGGKYKKDYCRIGCYDMAGNVAEWCEDWFEKEDVSNRAVCGGSFNDTAAAFFLSNGKRPLAPVTHENWVGFRGVVRLQVDRMKP